VAAASLRDAGLHPVVLSRDPLAQLLQAEGSARLLVPAEELPAARDLLGSSAPAAGDGSSSGAGTGSAAATICALLVLIAIYLHPASLPLVLGGVAAALLVVRRLRRRAGG
jgi:hypothetical protein